MTRSSGGWVGRLALAGFLATTVASCASGEPAAPAPVVTVATATAGATSPADVLAAVERDLHAVDGDLAAAGAALDAAGR